MLGEHSQTAVAFDCVLHCNVMRDGLGEQEFSRTKNQTDPGHFMDENSKIIITELG